MKSIFGTVGSRGRAHEAPPPCLEVAVMVVPATSVEGSVKMAAVAGRLRGAKNVSCWSSSEKMAKSMAPLIPARRDETSAKSTAF